MKLGKIIINAVRVFLISLFILSVIYTLTLIGPISITFEPGFFIGTVLGILAQGALLYYFLFKCKYKLIKKLLGKHRADTSKPNITSS